MERILVVDDSPDQTLLVESVLQQNGFETVNAADGVQALSEIARQTPDAVVTDLMMPKLNGLELVEALSDKYPSLPVILMTAFGSGEIAMQALQKGAVSYIPKRHVRQQIVDTLEQILELGRDRREQKRLLVSLVESDSSFVLTSDPTLVPAMVNHVSHGINARVARLGQNEMMRLGLAVQEALLNAIYHGNLELSSEIRETSSAEYLRLALERSTQKPYCDRQVRLNVHVDTDEVIVVVADDGQGFDISSVPDPTDAENLLRPSGRGLHLIGTIMDEVNHNEPGNTIEMIKYTE